MRQRFWRPAWSSCAVIWFSASAWAQVAANPSRETELQSRVEDFFSAYCQKDLPKLLAQWNAKSPDLAGHSELPC